MSIFLGSGEHIERKATIIPLTEMAIFCTCNPNFMHIFKFSSIKYSNLFHLSNLICIFAVDYRLLAMNSDEADGATRLVTT